MLVVRSPLRIGLAGGGSDLPEFFAHQSGAVLGLTFAKYVYVAMLPLAPIAHENFRFTYRHTESVLRAEDIEHPVVREVLSGRPDISKLNIATMADLPGGTGLGSSSAFTAALIAAVDAHSGEWRTPRALAMEAIELERRKLGEAGGWQDQAQTAHGGFRLYEFEGNSYRASEHLQGPWVDELCECLVLGHVGLPARRSSRHQIALTQGVRSGEVSGHLANAAAIARSSFESLLTSRSSQDALEIVAAMVREGWKEKVAASQGALSDVDAFVTEGVSRGAKAGKLLGAGGSGFVLFVLEVGAKSQFIQQWPEVAFTDVELSRSGTELVLGPIVQSEGGMGVCG